jgi:hypothetical protein
VARLVARHRERSLPISPVRDLGSATIGYTPTDVLALTTADGRSPGLRVITFRRLPGTRDPSGAMTEDSPLTVAGAAAALGDCSPALRSLLIPIWEPSICWIRGLSYRVKRRCTSPRISEDVVLNLQQFMC